MENFLYALSGIVIGGIISYIVSKYYYKKSIKTKSLSAFVQFITDILSDIDPLVKQKLNVSYNNQEVDKLYQMQFVIANNGDLPIKEIIYPLTLHIPKNGIVLDVNIIHIEPEGREVGYQISNDDSNNNFVTFNFPLLNSNEYFVAKLLIKGDIPKPQSVRRSRRKNLSEHETKALEKFNVYDHYNFKIIAADLPPQIKSTKLPIDYAFEITEDKSWGSFVAALFLLIFTTSIGYCLYLLKALYPNIYTWNFKTYFSDFQFVYILVNLSWVVVGILFLLSIGIMKSGVDSFLPKKKPKLLLPAKLRNEKLFRAWDM